jgi:predicted metal-dependent phosphoesterase TrpH
VSLAGAIARGPTDLHTHTTASDGSYDPAELVRRASDAGLEVLGITDHDTTDGLAEAEASASEHGLTIVPGVELNCDVANIHADILGYLIDPSADELQHLLARIRAARVERAKAMVAKLQAAGAEITYTHVEGIAGSGSVGRPHVAQALVDSGFVPDVGTAFGSWIGAKGPAYEDRFRLEPEAAVAVIRRAGGVPVLAHPVSPASTGRDDGATRRFVERLARAGLGGLECHYTGYSGEVIRWLNVLADHFGLVPTGGSDFHGPRLPERVLGGIEVPHDTLERLHAARA